MTKEKRIRQTPVRVPPSREDDLYRATRRQVERQKVQPEPSMTEGKQ